MCRWKSCSAIGTTKICRFCGTRFCSQCGRGDFNGIIKDEKCVICNCSVASAEIVEMAGKPERKENLWNVLTPTQAAWNIYASSCPRRISVVHYIHELIWDPNEDINNRETQFSTLLASKSVVVKSTVNFESSDPEIGTPEKSKKSLNEEQNSSKSKDKSDASLKKLKKSKTKN